MTRGFYRFFSIAIFFIHTSKSKHHYKHVLVPHLKAGGVQHSTSAAPIRLLETASSFSDLPENNSCPCTRNYVFLGFKEWKDDLSGREWTPKSCGRDWRSPVNPLGVVILISHSAISRVTCYARLRQFPPLNKSFFNTEWHSNFLSCGRAYFGVPG